MLFSPQSPLFWLPLSGTLRSIINKPTQPSEKENDSIKRQSYQLFVNY